MSEDHKKVFVSYDWGTLEHEQWVFDLVKDLRSDGVDAMIDKLITQTNTVQLERMMVERMNESDHVIMVLTKEYAQKADSMQGGVGFETLQSLPDLLSNSDKYIFILRHDGDFKDAVPSHLRGFHFIDFSSNSEYKRKYEQLLYRIEGVPYYELPPLGKKKELKPRYSNIENLTSNNQVFDDIDLPKLKELNDLEKDKLEGSVYSELVDLFNQLFIELENKNSNFQYTKEEINQQKHVFKLYLDGNLKTGVKIWRGNHLFQGINFQFGHMLDINSDNTLNESLVFNYNQNGEFTMKLMMNIPGNSEYKEIAAVVKELWNTRIEPVLKQ